MTKMIKRFCDKCGCQITKQNECAGGQVGRLGNTNDKSDFAFEILIRHKGVWNTGDYCKYCVIDLVKTWDDRITPACKPATPDQSSPT